MSDRELVTIDAGQFSTLDSKVNALRGELQIIRDRLGPPDKDKNLYQVLSQLEQTIFNGFKALIEAGQNGGSGSEVLTAINNLDRKVDTFMATQEERLQAILTAVQTVKQMLADLKVNNPAIEDEITAIEAELAPADTGGGEGDTGGGAGTSSRSA